ncbi:MAG: hypothetical protein ACREMY_03140 [bacterium]
MGDVLTKGGILYTARLIGDPVALTIRVIDKLGFLTVHGVHRWLSTAMPHFIWLTLTRAQKRDVIGWMYEFEGGTEMRLLFPNYGKL